jgi:hypothetical protein
MEKIMDRIRAFPLPAMGAAFLAGLLLGWLAIGWWFWPVTWTDADPWDLRAEYQQAYITLVAKEYAQSRNLNSVRRALVGWDKQMLADLVATVQEQTPDPGTRQQLADLTSVLALPPGEVAVPSESVASVPIPLFRTRLMTVCGTAGLTLAIFVLIIFSVSTHPWKLALAWARRVQRPRAGRGPQLITGRFVSTYTQNQDDYEDYFSIEAPNGQFLGECGLSIGRSLGQGKPQRVTALEMVLFDSFDHRTETRMIMSHYAYEDEELQQELVMRGELVLAESGVQSLVETNNLQMVATIASVRYADQEPLDGVFQRVEVDLDVRIKHLPEEARREPDEVQGVTQAQGEGRAEGTEAEPSAAT